MLTAPYSMLSAWCACANIAVLALQAAAVSLEFQGVLCGTPNLPRLSADSCEIHRPVWSTLQCLKVQGPGLIECFCVCASDSEVYYSKVYYYICMCVMVGEMNLHFGYTLGA